MREPGKLSSGKAAEVAAALSEAGSRYRVTMFDIPYEEIETELQADLQAAGGSTTP